MSTQHIKHLVNTDKYQLYFDGNCPLCAKEMTLLSRIKKPMLQLVDIHRIPNLQEETKEQLLKVLHLQEPNGTWLKGLDANVKAWSFTPVGFLWAPLRWRIWKKKADNIYLRWAEKRYCRNYACSIIRNG